MCGSILKFVPWIAKIFRFVNWEIVVCPRVQHLLPGSESPLTSPEILQSANLFTPSSKTNHLLRLVPPLSWDSFLLLQAHSGLRSQGVTPPALCISKQVWGVELGPSTMAVVTLETMCILKLYSSFASFSLIQRRWIRWSIAGAIPRCERSQRCWRVIWLPPWGTCIICILLHIFYITFIYLKKDSIRFS